MSSALAMVLTVAVTVSGNGLEKVSGEAQMKFPPGSKWVSVEGWKGLRKVVEASVTFKSGNEVEIYWKASTQGGGSFAVIETREYRFDRRSMLPVIPPRISLDGEGVFSLVGNRLKLERGKDHPFFQHNIREPLGRLLLFLEPGE